MYYDKSTIVKAVILAVMLTIIIGLLCIAPLISRSVSLTDAERELRTYRCDSCGYPTEVTYKSETTTIYTCTECGHEYVMKNSWFKK